MKKRLLTILGGALLGFFSMNVTAQNWEDVTSDYIQNSGFEDDPITFNESGTLNSSAERVGTTGWVYKIPSWNNASVVGNNAVQVSTGSYGQTAAVTNGQNGTMSPSSDNDGNGGACLHMSAGWGDDAIVTQESKIALPAGKYKLTYHVYNRHSNTGIAVNFCGVKVGSVSTTGTLKTAAQDKWVSEDVIFSVPTEQKVTFSIGFTTSTGGSGNGAKLYVDNICLAYDKSVDKSSLNLLISEANDLCKEGTNDFDIFKGAIQLAQNTYDDPDATAADVVGAEAALQEAIDAFKWANASPENPVDVTSKIVNPDCSSTTGWNLSTCASNSGQHWDGTTTNTYLEPCNWGANSWTASAIQTISLPNGHYKLVAAGRASEGVTLNLVANSQKVAFVIYGDVGGTIATDGTEWVNVAAGIAAGKSFANSNNGRGWNYKSIDDIIIIDQDLTLGAESSSSTSHSWCSIDDFKLFYQGPITEEDQIPAAKDKLKSALNDAKAVPTANIGTGAFQYPATEVDAYAAALTAAQNVYDNSESTLAQIEEATESVKNAVFPTLNGPADDTRYTITQKNSGWQYDGNAMTYIAGGRNDMGGYNIQYKAAPASYYAQAFKFTAVEGQKNCYTLSQKDNDGDERYICTGAKYSGGNATQIRTTTEVNDALVVEVRATSSEDKWNLWNTEANQYIGSQDAGVFTVGSNNGFALAVAPKATATLSVTDVHWGTFIAPFDVTIPEGVEAYTCTGVEGTSITMEEVETKIPANTPVIVYSENTYCNTFSDYGHATDSKYEGDKLTGVYVATQAPANSYVLMANNGSAVFGQVVEDDEPTVGANRCYLTVPSGTSSTILRFGDATGIQSVEQQGETVIYDLTGRRVDAAVKGIYIVGGKKMLVK